MATSGEAPITMGHRDPLSARASELLHALDDLRDNLREFDKLVDYGENDYPAGNIMAGMMNTIERCKNYVAG